MAILLANLTLISARNPHVLRVRCGLCMLSAAKLTANHAYWDELLYAVYVRHTSSCMYVGRTRYAANSQLYLLPGHRKQCSNLLSQIGHPNDLPK